MTEHDKPPGVFISYARADEAMAHRLKTDLEAAGHPRWLGTAELQGAQT